MPPRLNPWVTCRSLAVRLRPLARVEQPRLAVAFGRSFADDVAPTTQQPTPPTADERLRVPSPFNLGPTIFGEGQQQQQQQRAGEGDAPAATRPDGEGVGAALQAEPEPLDPVAARLMERMSQGLDPYDMAEDGHKFAIPGTPWKSGQQLQDRYDPVLTQLSRLIMRHGKLSKAYRDMAHILEYLRTSPPPTINPARPLLPGSPPPSHLPLDPIRYLTVVVDSVAPLIRVARYGGILGGGQAMDVPLPLRVRQRRRLAFRWILDAVEKKPSRGSGRKQFPFRVAEEIVAVAEGRSAVWNKRLEVHKMGTAARANLSNARLKL